MAALRVLFSLTLTMQGTWSRNIEVRAKTSCATWGLRVKQFDRQENAHLHNYKVSLKYEVQRH